MLQEGYRMLQEGYRMLQEGYRLLQEGYRMLHNDTSYLNFYCIYSKNYFNLHV